MFHIARLCHKYVLVWSILLLLAIHIDYRSYPLTIWNLLINSYGCLKTCCTETEMRNAVRVMDYYIAQGCRAVSVENICMSLLWNLSLPPQYTDDFTGRQEKFGLTMQEKH